MMINKMQVSIMTEVIMLTMEYETAAAQGH